MSNEVKKGELFIREVVARLTGDGAEAKAAKISRKALSAVEGQLASLKAKVVDQENSLEDAQEALKTAKYPTEFPSSNQSYVDAILRAQRTVDENQANLDSTNKAIEYFEGLLKSF